MKEIMKISNREMWLIISTFIVISIFILFIYLNKKLPVFDNNNIKIDSLNSLIISAKRNINMNDIWLKNLESLEEDLKIFKKSQNNVSPELMQIINNIASKNGVIITRTQPFKEKPIGDLFEVSINCSWQSDLNSIVSFLTEIQKNGLKYDITTLNISPDIKNSKKLKGNMVIQCAYIKK